MWWEEDSDEGQEIDPLDKLVNPPKLSTLNTKEQYLQSRRLAIQSFFEERCDLDSAVAAYKRYAHDGYAKRVSPVKRFIKYQLYKWYDHNSVANRPHQKPPQQVDDEVAKQFAYKLAMGCAQHTSAFVNGQYTDHWHHRRYFDLQDAYHHDRYIKHIMDTCGSVPQLMRRAKAVDPDLAWCWQHIKADIEVELKQEGAGEELDEFLKEAVITGVQDAQPLTNQEVALLLDKYRAQNAQTTPGFCPPPMVTKTQAYLEQVIAGSGKNMEAAQAIRERMNQRGVDGVEMVLLVNLMPENAEEAYALVPSLKRKEGLDREALNELLEELHSYRTYH